MSELRIYITEGWRGEADACPWALLGEDGALLDSGTSAMRSMPKGHDAAVILSAESVLIVKAALPARGRRQLQKILPYAVEEFVLTDPDESHVVPGAALGDGKHLLYVLDKSRIRMIAGALAEAGLSLRRMLPETSLPDCDENGWTLIWHGNRGFVCTGLNQGLALEGSSLQAPPVSLKLALEAAQKLPLHIEIRLSRECMDEVQAAPSWSELQVPVKAGPAWDWRRAAVPEGAMNLLWGEFAPRAKITEWWPRLRPAITLLGMILLVEIAGSNIQWLKLSLEKSGLTAQMQKTFREVLSETAVIVNAPLQMARNLSEIRHAAGVPDSGDFLPLLDRASRALSSLPSGSVVALHFEQGRLDVEVRMARKEGFQVLKQSLQGNDLVAKVGEMRDLGNAIEAKVSVYPAGGI